MPRRSRRGGQPKKETPAHIAAQTAAQKRAFLDQFVAVGNISGAARALRMSRDTHYAWLGEDAAYKAAFEVAQEEATDALEQEARRRALVGVDKPIFHQGRQVATVKEHSDTLLIFLLKGHKPGKYRERYEHVGKDGGPIQVHKRVTFGGRYKPAAHA